MVEVTIGLAEAVAQDQADPVDQAQALEEATLDAPTTVTDGLTASVRCPPGGAPLPASIPSPAEDQARSTPTTPTVPMFPQDVRDVMMSAPKEMENRISWTTDQEEAIQAALELGMTILEVINVMVT